MRIASVLLGLPLVASVLITCIQGPRHLSWQWPVHAQHHLLGHITTVVGLSVVSLLLVVGPLQRRERWAWWALVVTGVSLFGGFWLGNLMVGLGEPGAVPNTSQALQASVYLLGLVLAWRGVSVRASA